MKKQYRIKFKNQTLSDPLDREGIQYAIEKYRLLGDEKIQIYPDGEWEELKGHKVFQDQQATFMRKLSDFDLTAEDDLPEEESEAEAEEKGEKSSFEDFPVPSPEEYEASKEKEREEREEREREESLSDQDKTVIREVKKPSILSVDDKTIIRPDTLKYLEKLKREEEQKIKEESLRKKREVQVDYNKESTQVLDLSKLKKELTQEIEKTEKEFHQIEKEKKEREAKKSKEKRETSNEEVKTEKKSKKKILYLLVVLAIAYVLFFPEEKPVENKEVKLLYPDIQFPIEYEKPNVQKSKNLFLDALDEINKHSYFGNLKASKILTKSVEWNLANTDSLTKLFLINSMLLSESQKVFREANTTFKIHQIIPGSVYSSIDHVKGMAYFYRSIGKSSAALYALEKYARADKNTSLEIYALWLELLLDKGLLGEARDKYETLKNALASEETAKHASPDIYHALIRYLEVQSFIKEANNWANKGVASYPKSVRLLLDKIRLYMRNEDKGGMRRYLMQVRAESSGMRPSFHAEFLEYMGVYQVLNKKFEDAAKLFSESLKIKESVTLRSRIATLDPSGEFKVVDNLIKESKAIDQYNKGKEFLNTDDWRNALKYVTRSVDIDPHFIPAHILFSRLQVRSGFYEQAIFDLQKSIKKNGKSKDLYFALLEIYIDIFKVREAQDLVSVISSAGMDSDPRFPSLMAKLYGKMGDELSSANWYVNALNKNPLNDRDYFELAKLYMKNNRFNEARGFLERAIELEPFEVKYRAAYARYLYDVKGTDVAIGYLLDLMKDEKFFSQKAYLTGEIGIYYYRSGKIENFEDIQKKLVEMDYPKKNLYEYVIKTSMIDNRYDDVIKNAIQLLEIEPGDIKTRMFLGKIYFEQERFTKALEQFREVRDMMSSYPRLKYYIAKAYLSIGDRNKAYEMAQEEVQTNPHLADGYILTGDIAILKEKWLEGERNYRKALRIKGDSVDAVKGLAYINYKKNKLDSALALYRKAQELDPSNAENYRMLGEIYRLLGQGQKAVDHYEVYLKKVPNSKHQEGIRSYIKIME